MTTPHVLMAQRYSTDGVRPALYEFVKIRLPEALDGPGSSIRSSAVTGATSGNYHTAIIKEVFFDSRKRRIFLEVWPVPAYSNATRQSYASSIHWVNDLPLEGFNLHIPVPCVQQAAGIVPTTPQAFGDPLEVHGWEDRIPSWVYLKTQTVTFAYTQSWKRFQPRVYLSPGEARRLEIYSNQINDTSDAISSGPTTRSNSPDSTHQPPNQKTNNKPGLPPATHAESTDMSQQENSNPPTNTTTTTESRSIADFLLADRRPIIVIPDDNSADSDDNCIEDCGVDPIAFARFFAPQDPAFAAVIRNHDLKEEIHMEERILGWMKTSL